MLVEEMEALHGDSGVAVGVSLLHSVLVEGTAASSSTSFLFCPRVEKSAFFFILSILSIKIPTIYELRTRREGGASRLVCFGAISVFLENKTPSQITRGRGGDSVLQIEVCSEPSWSVVTVLWSVGHQAPVRGIFLVGMVEWIVVSSARGPSHPGIEPVSPALAGGFFTTEPL